MKRDETFVHVAIRNYLRANGWTLIAGQFPGGSDDELHTFNIVDSLLARDQSPDHRRHSSGKLVPDLIAYKAAKLLIIEAKPEYSILDKEKLAYLLSDRRSDFLSGLKKFTLERDLLQILPIETLDIIPVLAFLKERSPAKPDTEIAQLIVEDLNTVETYGLK
jgi:Holliday junction resolvase